MLTLEIKEKQLSTDENFSTQIEDQNPATKFDGIVGSMAIGVELPINDINRIILDNPDRFEKMGNINDRRFSGCALRHYGQIIQKGTLVILEASKKTYSGWLRDIVGNLAEHVAGTYINQTTLAGAKTFVNKTTYDPASDDYACPKIFNRHFWRDRGKITEEQITATDMEGQEYKTTEEGGRLTFQFFNNQEFFVNYPTAEGVVVSGLNNAPVVSPMLFLWRALELILSDNYVFVKENFLKEDANLKKLIIYNNYNIINSELTTQEDLFYYEVYYTGKGISARKKYVSEVEYQTGSFSYQDLLPKMKLGEAILSCQNLLNVVFSFNDLNECRIVDRNLLLTQPAFDVDEYMVGEWELGERKDVTIKLSQEHDPQDYAFSDNWQDLSDIRQHIKDPVQQVTDLDALTPEMDEIRLVEGENHYYQYHWYVLSTIEKQGETREEDILGWEPLTTAFQPYFYNDGFKDIEEIKTKFSTLRQSVNGYPLTMQKGNANMFKTQHEAFTPRLLFYEGDEVASYRTSTLSLDYAEQNGLAKGRWGLWLPFWANRLPANALFKFPASIFYYIKNNKAILPLRTRHGSFIIDKIEAIAGKADMIETRLHVFKRESVMDYTEGNVPGDGEAPVQEFVPIYVGITSTGKPYLVNNVGEVRVPPAWGPISTTPHAKTVCIDYDAVTKQMYVGGNNGMLYITDLSDKDNIGMKGIKVLPSGTISCVRKAGSYILIGKDFSAQVYKLPVQAVFANYADNQASETGILANGYVAKDFEYDNGTYFACTQAGEIFRSTNLSNNWQELGDIKADFRKMIKTTNKVMTFGKDDNNSDDRNFYALKTNTNSWPEFDIDSTAGIYVTEAYPMANDRALLITNKEFTGATILNSNLSITQLYGSLGKYYGGACVNEGDEPVIGIQEGTGATKIAIRGILGWRYHNVPAFFTKLFMY